MERGNYTFFFDDAVPRMRIDTSESDAKYARIVKLLNIIAEHLERIENVLADDNVYPFGHTQTR